MSGRDAKKRRPGRAVGQEQRGANGDPDAVLQSSQVPAAYWQHYGIGSQDQRGSAGNGEAAVTEGDGMMVAEIPRETLDTIRHRQSGRLMEAGRLARRAVLRFESILRRRDAAPVIAQGFGSTASNRVVGWYKDNLHKCGFKVLDLAGVSEAGEWVDHKIPVGLKDVPVVGTLYEATKEGIEAENRAKRAGATVGVVDDLVSSTMEKLERLSAEATARLTAPGNDLYLMELERTTDYGRPPITSADVDELIATLDAMFSRAMFDLGPARGGYTVKEYGERIAARKHLQAEIDATRQDQDKPE